jgi:hypothetical protein
MNKICLIFSVCEAYHQSRTKPLYETVCLEAINLGHTISLISGFDPIDSIPIQRLTEQDDYESAIDKNLKAMLFHYNNQTEFDYFMICDDDTFINFNNLSKVIDNLDKDKLALYGCVGEINGDGRLHVTGGPGILMNRNTFIKIAETIKTHYIRHVINSDVSVALNVHRYNEECKGDKIEFINIPSFLHPHLQLKSIKEVATYHISNRNCYYDLYNELAN